MKLKFNNIRYCRFYHPCNCKDPSYHSTDLNQKMLVIFLSLPKINSNRREIISEINLWVVLSSNFIMISSILKYIVLFFIQKGERG